MWKEYYPIVDGIVFMVDCTKRDRFEEAAEELSVSCHIHIHTYIHIRVYIYIHTGVYSIDMNQGIYIHTGVYIYTHTWVYTYILGIYTHIYNAYIRT